MARSTGRTATMTIRLAPAVARAVEVRSRSQERSRAAEIAYLVRVGLKAVGVDVDEAAPVAD